MVETQVLPALQADRAGTEHRPELAEEDEVESLDFLPLIPIELFTLAFIKRDGKIRTLILKTMSASAPLVSRAAFQCLQSP
jgi:hypothetical protein